MKMKRSFFFAVFALLLGFFLGTVFPPGMLPWSTFPLFHSDRSIVSSAASPANNDPTAFTAPTLKTSDSEPEPALDTQNNSVLLQTACAVVNALHDEDYSRLAELAHPKLGITFTPYSTVNLEADLTFTAAQISTLASNQQTYIWGIEDGRGEPIELTMTDYLHTFVYDQDYSKAPRVGIDQILQSGNALENLTEVYQGARFVDFNFPGTEDGMDWFSLKVVLLPVEDEWKLVGLVHGQWTI